MTPTSARLQAVLDEVEDMLEGAENAADDGQPGWRGVQHKLEEAKRPLTSAMYAAQQAEASH